MKTLLFCSLVLFNLNIARASSESEKSDLESYLTVEKVQIKEVPVSLDTLIELHAQMDIKPLPVPVPNVPGLPPPGVPPYIPVPLPGTGNLGKVNEIINIGLKVWSIIKENRPVVNLDLNRANALPVELKNWVDMERWSDIKFREYQVVYINGLKNEVVKMHVLLTYSHGGTYNGVGQYLSQVGILVKNLEVAWGYKVDASSEVSRVVNSGTRENPLALMELNFKWSVSTVLKHIQDATLFSIKGNGEVIAY